MRVRHSRLADKLMFVAWVTTNLSQRMAEPQVQPPRPGNIYPESTRGSDRVARPLDFEAREARARPSTCSSLERTRFGMCPSRGPPRAGYTHERIRRWRRATERLKDQLSTRHTYPTLGPDELEKYWVA